MITPVFLPLLSISFPTAGRIKIENKEKAEYMIPIPIIDTPLE